MDQALHAIPLPGTVVPNFSDYEHIPTKHFNEVPEMAKPLLYEAKTIFSTIERRLYMAPAFINAVKAAIPDSVLQAVLTDEQKQALAKGSLKLMTKKDGSLMASLINPESGKIITNVPLESIQVTPDLAQAMTSFSTQMQLTQIAEELQTVQQAVEEVHMGQEYDRLATAYSCQQKLLQALAIKDPQLKTIALIQLVSSAEDSRNLLMLSQKNNIKLIIEQPEGFIQKVVSGSDPEKINSRMGEIRGSLCAVNMVSFAEAMAYQELGEQEAAKKSFMYYADFIEDTYTSDPGLLERLDLIDPSPKNYWSKTLPDISSKIKALPYMRDIKRLEAEMDEEEKENEAQK